MYVSSGHEAPERSGVLAFQTKITAKPTISESEPLPDWSRRFADPIPVQNGKPTLRHVREGPTGDFAIRSPLPRRCSVSVLAAIHAKGRPHLSRLPLTPSRCTTAFDFRRPFRRGLRLARPPFALGIGLHGADRLRLRANRLPLRIADRLGQHLMQLGLGRRRRLCHLATISLLISRLPWPSAQPSIVRNFSGRLAALSRIPLMPSVCRCAEKPSPGLVALGPSLFYRA